MNDILKRAKPRPIKHNISDPMYLNGERYCLTIIDKWSGDISSARDDNTKGTVCLAETFLNFTLKV